MKTPLRASIGIVVAALLVAGGPARTQVVPRQSEVTARFPRMSPVNSVVRKLRMAITNIKHGSQATRPNPRWIVSKTWSSHTSDCRRIQAIRKPLPTG